MATRCRIAIKNEDGTYNSIYCHNDGYPEGVGRTLRNYYTDEQKVRDLLALGDISSLGKTLDYKKTFGDDGFDISSLAKDEGTTDYNRWRNEGTHSLHSDNIDDLRDLAMDSGAEYLYIFKNGSWKIEEF